MNKDTKKMKPQLHILLVEDSADDASLIIRHLQQGGYDLAFERVESWDAMVGAVERRTWDLIISDYYLPQFSGIDVLKLLRAKGMDVPFIFVSGVIGEDVAISALKLGAQDYVMKGNLKRLIPAIDRELRETEARRERARLDQRLQQLERFEAIGKLAGGVAHDFNNVIGVLVGWAQLGAEEASSHPQLKERFQKIRDEAQRAAGFTSQLLAFAHSRLLQRKCLNLNASILGMSHLLRTAIGEKIEFTTTLAPDLHQIRADPTQIDQILMNLCLNARDAMPNGGRLALETRNVTGRDLGDSSSLRPPEEGVLLLVSDTGTGMDEATRTRMFEPFFTTKEVGQGTGLGLATVHDAVKQHEGAIYVDSEIGVGTRFRIYFPSASQESKNEDSSNVIAPESGEETVLVAEDHAGLRELADAFLTSRGYNVILARNGEEAVRLFLENQAKVQLVILDVVMPLMGGPEAYTIMSRTRPGIPVVFSTGHTVESSQLSADLKKNAAFLQKPYAPKELGQVLRKLLDRANVERNGKKAVGD